MPASHSKRRFGKWALIIAIVVLIHIALFLLLRPGWFGVFRKSPTATAETGADDFFPSNAILTIPIETEDLSDSSEAGYIGEPVETRKRIVIAEPVKPVAVGESELDALLEAGDPDDPAGGSPKALPRSSSAADVAIPPRALEITWPDTRSLKHCAGHLIDIKIRVDGTGAVLAVEPLDQNHPADCLRAALESAAKIVFEAGQVNGVPTAMWTQVRIEFRAKQ